MSTGHHEASWRLPESDPFAHLDVAHFQRLAQIAERGKLDSVFFADSPVLWGDIGRRPSGALEPTVLLTAIAMATSRIGLVATASTTYNDPFNLARRFASVDVVSGGRAGWNVVTTAGPDAAGNFGLDDQPAHGERYERADEFLEVAYRLWDSWDDDAPLGDKASGVLGRPVADPRDRPRRPALPRPRAAQPAALAAGSPGDRPGGLVRGRQGPRVAARGGRLHRPADPRRRARVLPRPQAADGGDRPRPRQYQDPARHRAR